MEGFDMLKKSNFFMMLIIGLSLTNCGNKYVYDLSVCEPTPAVQQQFSLADYDYYSASVFPTITEDGVLYGILSREAFGRKNKFGKLHKYDDFSGSRDEGEVHPIETAAHEFLQEGILEKILQWNLKQTEEFIKPENGNTWSIIACSIDKNPDVPHVRKTRNVTYLTHFDQYKDVLFNKFHDARKQEVEQYKKEGISKQHWTNAEKDRLAKVKWDDLKAAIINQEDLNEIVEVEALVMNPKTKRFKKQTIQLRPFLVIKLRPFFMNESYQQGEHEKIRHYQN